MKNCLFESDCHLFFFPSGTEAKAELRFWPLGERLGGSLHALTAQETAVFPVCIISVLRIKLTQCFQFSITPKLNPRLHRKKTLQDTRHVSPSYLRFCTWWARTEVQFLGLKVQCIKLLCSAILWQMCST